ncbi:MAG: adenylate/guanylate cyclase domain-containing protein [Anaerolineae bacterium]|jgi:PAS domain S-box-containing protein|nr:adenylate/guanylate cyclase domain-containing protein [Anaerolineae bacterium]
MRKGAPESSTYTHIAAQIVRSIAFIKIIEENIDLLPSSEAERKILNSTSGLRDEYRKIEKSINALEDERQSFHALVSTGRIINSTLDPDEVLQVAMDNIIRLTDAERGFLMMAEDDGSMRIQVARDWEQETVPEEDFSISQSIISRVVIDKAPILTTNAQEDPRFTGQDSIIAYCLRSIMCVPLLLKQALIGVIYVDNRLRTSIFTNTDLNALQAFANQTAVAIENARLFSSLTQTLIEVTELKNLMDSVFNSMATGLITTDLYDEITLCNPAAGKIFGYDVVKLLGKKLHTVLPRMATELRTHLVEAVINESSSMGLEVSEQMPLKGDLDLRLSIAPLRSGDENVQGVAIVVEDETERKRLQAQRRLFQRMVSPAVIAQIDPDDLDLEGRRATLTTLFADVRGFTSYSEITRPEKLFTLLNAHLRVAVDAILNEEGTIDKFQGDAIMAWFNAPMLQPDHPMRAIRAAIALHRGIQELHWSLPNVDQLKMGVGIHVGEAVLGLVGTEQRMEYTAIGDSVNTAKRLQENARPGQILITDTLYQLVKDQVVVNPSEPLKVKGKREILQVYEVLGLA